MSATEQRINLKFLAKLGISASESLGMLKKVYKKATMSRSACFTWHKRFREGREQVEDDPRSGRPTTSMTDDNIERVRKAVEESKTNLSIRNLARKLEMNHNGVWKIIKDEKDICRVYKKKQKSQALLKASSPPKPPRLKLQKLSKDSDSVKQAVKSVSKFQGVREGGAGAGDGTSESEPHVDTRPYNALDTLREVSNSQGLNSRLEPCSGVAQYYGIRETEPNHHQADGGNGSTRRASQLKSIPTTSQELRDASSTQQPRAMNTHQHRTIANSQQMNTATAMSSAELLSASSCAQENHRASVTTTHNQLAVTTAQNRQDSESVPAIPTFLAHHSAFPPPPQLFGHHNHNGPLSLTPTHSQFHSSLLPGQHPPPHLQTATPQNVAMTTNQPRHQGPSQTMNPPGMSPWSITML